MKNTCALGSTSGHGHLDVFCSVAAAMIPTVSVRMVYTPSIVEVAVAFGRVMRALARHQELVVPSQSVSKWLKSTHLPSRVSKTETTASRNKNIFIPL
ncbi:unnamed protein product, partial [Gulo gulo]